jgi:hypothetical protein
MGSKEMEGDKSNHEIQTSYLYFDIEESLKKWTEDDSKKLLELTGNVNDNMPYEVGIEKARSFISLLSKFQLAMGAMVDSIRKEISTFK